MKNQPVPGMKDLTDQASIYRSLENDFFRILLSENFKEIRTPILESKSLFSRSVGDESDIVQKEMFETKTDEFVLRPENTAPIVRALLNNYKVPAKFAYFSPQFRKEQPQLGRLRQFYQYGFEMFGDSAPQSEIEALLIVKKLYDTWGLKQYEIEVNYLGNSQERANYLVALRSYLNKNMDNLSDNSKKRLDRNVLRVLDSKELCDQEVIKNAPIILEYLLPESMEQWNKFLNIANSLSLDIKVNPRLVRGLDYYTGMVFEVSDTSGRLGSQKALGGGGRYDNLCKELGGQDTPAFGFAGGVERLIIALDLKEVVPVKTKVSMVTTEPSLIPLFYKIKEKNPDVFVDILFDYNTKFKKMFKRADKNDFDFVIIMGQDELMNNKFKVKNLKTGQETDFLDLNSQMDLKLFLK